MCTTARVDSVEEKAYHPTYFLHCKPCGSPSFNFVLWWCIECMCGRLEHLLYTCCSITHYQFYWFYLVVPRIQLTYVDHVCTGRRTSKKLAAVRTASAASAANVSDETSQPRSKQEILDSLKNQVSKPMIRRRGGGGYRPETTSRLLSVQCFNRCKAVICGD